MYLRAMKLVSPLNSGYTCMPICMCLYVSGTCVSVFGSVKMLHWRRSLETNPQKYVH